MESKPDKPSADQPKESVAAKTANILKAASQPAAIQGNLSTAAKSKPFQKKSNNKPSKPVPKANQKKAAPKEEEQSTSRDNTNTPLTVEKKDEPSSVSAENPAAKSADDETEVAEKSAQPSDKPAELTSKPVEPIAEVSSKPVEPISKATEPSSKPAEPVSAIIEEKEKVSLHDKAKLASEDDKQVA